MRMANMRMANLLTCNGGLALKLICKLLVIIVNLIFNHNTLLVYPYKYTCTCTCVQSYTYLRFDPLFHYLCDHSEQLSIRRLLDQIRHDIDKSFSRLLWHHRDPRLTHVQAKLKEVRDQRGSLNVGCWGG